jgi:asparagine synthase (glutamine-hydrolysing)
MSTLFGLYHPGSPDALDAGIRTMRQAMDYWHPDGSGVIREGAVALGHLLLHNTPESLHETQPYRLDDYWITADARIDNRNELLSILKDPPPEGTRAPDAVIILHLYREKGRHAIPLLKGDFACAIWDPAKHQLLCARDQIGVKNLFFARTGAGFAFASEIRGIIALPDADRSVDDAFVDCLLTGDDPAADQTFYHTVKRLLPGHHVVFQGGEPEVERYWFPGLPPLLKLGSRSAYLDAFRESFREAVRRRMRTVFPISAELSGGLDSSAVTCIAASLVDDPGRLFTFSNVLAKNSSGEKPYRDEEAFIDDVTRHCGVRQVVKVSASGRSFPLAYHDLELDVNSGVDVYSAWWQEPLRREMSDRSIRVTLSGFGGDEAITNRSGWYFRDYLREGRYLRFLQAAVQGGHYMLPGKLALKAIAPGLARWMKAGRPRKLNTMSYLKAGLVPAKSLQQRQSDMPLKLDGYRGYLQQMIMRDYTCQRIQSEGLFAIRHKLEPRYPLIDLDLVQLFLSLPLEIIGHPRKNRFLFREAMEGILPDSVRLRSDKLVSAGIYYLQEARDNAPFFLEWLREREGRPGARFAGRINLTAMINGWDPGNTGNWVNGGFVPKGSFRAECLLRMDELIEQQRFPLSG